MGKQIQIVGANNAPYVAKELDLESGNQFTFAKPDGTAVVEVGALDFIKAVEDYDTFKDWVINYKRDANTIIPLRIDKIAGNVETEKIVYTFTNDDVDVSSITLVKLIVEMVNATNEISASYVDETKEIEAGTVLPTPSADDNGKLLGVDDGEYALVNGNPAIPTPTADDNGKVLGVAEGAYALVSAGGSGGMPYVEIDVSNSASASTIQDVVDVLGGDYKGYAKITYKQTSPYPSTQTFDLIWINYSSYGRFGWYIPITENSEFAYKGGTSNFNIEIQALQSSSDNKYQLVRLPSDTSKTYTYKFKNGSIQWAEDQA